MSFRSKEFKGLNDEFNYAAAPILDGTDTSLEAFENLLDCYNTVVNYAAIDYENKKHKTKEQIQTSISVNRITLQRVYEKLGIPLTLPGKLLSTIHYLPNSRRETTVSATQTERVTVETLATQSEPTNVDNSYTQSERVNTGHSATQTDGPIIPQISTMDKAHFLKLCGSQINYTYSGDPLALESFIASIDLLKDVGTDLSDTLKLFVLARLSGKAQECVRKNPNSVDQIVEDLKKYIKPDNSKVIEGRLQALRFNAGKPQEFTTQAEELSEALQRTLILEGVGQEKAREMTVERTVDLCRQSSKTDFVRGVIAAAAMTFKTPKEVLATFVVENGKEKTEKQILTLRSQNNRTNNQNRQSNGRGRGNFNGNRQRNYNNNNYQNNWNNGNGNSRNYRRGNRQSQSNYRGRGGYRNNSNNYNNNGNNYNNNDRYVRVVAENYPGPSNGRAEQETSQANQPTILRLSQNNRS